MNAHDLARAAESAGKATRRYTPMEPYIPSVDVLRRKGWSWEAIHTWLRAQGQHVQESPATFAACMGRCYRRWLTRETARRSPQPRDTSFPEPGPRDRPGRQSQGNEGSSPGASSAPATTSPATATPKP